MIRDVTQPLEEQDLVDLGRQYQLRRFLTWKARFRFSMAMRADFYADLAEERRNKSRLNDALFHIWEIETHGGTARLHSPLGVIIPVILYRMHDIGEDFDQALTGWVPALETLVLSTTPKTGLSPDILSDLSEVIKKLSVWSSTLIYAALPLFVVVTMIIGIFYGAGAYYFPKLLKRMPWLRLNGEAAVFYGISDFFLHWGWLVFLALFALVILLFSQAPHATGKARKLIDNIWPATLYRQWAGIGFIVSLAALVKAHRQDKDALTDLAAHSTPYVQERIDAILATDDKKLGHAMAASDYDWPDDMVIRKVIGAMEREDPGIALQNLSYSLLDRMTAKMVRTAATISWGGTIAVSLIVAWLTFAMNDITTTIQDQARDAIHKRTAAPPPITIQNATR